MRTCLVAFVLTCLVALTQPAFSQTEDWPSQSVSTLVAALSSDDEKKREQAHEDLAQFAWLIASHDVAGRLPAGASKWHFFILESDQASRKKSAESRRQLQEAIPQFVAYLRQHPESEWSVIPTCLAVAKRDGSALFDARASLPKSPMHDAIILGSFMQMAMMTMPEEQSVIARILQESEKLSLETRTALDGYWQKRDDPESYVWIQINGPGTFFWVGQLTASDRLNVELPHLTKSLDNRYPDILRAALMVIIAELGVEAAPCETQLTTVLKDDEEDMRLLAAHCLVAIHEYEPGYAKALLSQVELSEKKQTEILDHAKMRRDEQKETTRFLIESLNDPTFADQFKYLQEMVESDHQLFRRSALRILRQMGSHSRFALTQIKKASTSKDDVTRSLAAELLEQLEQ